MILAGEAIPSLGSLEVRSMVTAAVGPSVVHIDVQRRTELVAFKEAGLLSDHLIPEADQGSGVVVDAAGYVLTNQHVIADGKGINVTLSDGRRTKATVVGVDELTDLALLKINADRLMPITWGDSDRCKVDHPCGPSAVRLGSIVR